MSQESTKVKWFQTEAEQAPLELTFVHEYYWKDKEGKFYFNDETQADVCGPFDTLMDAELACADYAKTL